MTKPLVTILDIFPSQYRDVMRHQLPADFELRLIANYDLTTIYTAIADVEFILVGGEVRVDGALLDKAPNLKLLLKRGVGYDKIDVAAAKERKITVCITPVFGVTVSVAEHTVALLMGVLRKLEHLDKVVKKGGWRCHIMLPTYQLCGRTVGLVGMGAIAREVVKRLQPFSVHIRYFDVFRQPPEVENELSITYVPSVDALFADADIVSMHTPLTAETRGMVGKKQLFSMKPNGVFINCSRGEVVNEPELIEVLQSGHLAGAGLDVLTKEPPEKDNVLLKMDNVLLSPHWAVGDVDTIISQVQHAFTNIRRFINKETIPADDIVG